MKIIKDIIFTKAFLYRFILYFICFYVLFFLYEIITLSTPIVIDILKTDKTILNTVIGGILALSGTLIALLASGVGFLIRHQFKKKEIKKEKAQVLLIDIYKYKDKVFDWSLKILRKERIPILDEDRNAIRAAQMIYFPELQNDFLSFSNAVENLRMFYFNSYKTPEQPLDKQKQKELLKAVSDTLTKFEFAIQKKV